MRKQGHSAGVLQQVNHIIIMQTYNKRAFSLIELLVALSILAVVAAVIVPRFLNVRTQAAETATQNQQRTLQRAVQQFLSLGGQITSGTSGNVLAFLAVTAPSSGTNAFDRSNGGATTLPSGLTDSGGAFGSSTISVSLGTSLSGPITSAGGVGAGYYYAAGSNAEYSDGVGGIYTITITPTPGSVSFAPKSGVTGQTATKTFN